MYCPGCGVLSSDDQQFCRSCGLGLQMHAQILTYQRLLNESDQTRINSNERSQIRRHRMLYRVFITSIALGALTFLATGTGHLYFLIASLSLLVGGIVGMTLCTEAPFLFYSREF